MTSAVVERHGECIPRPPSRKPPRARVPPRARRFHARHPGPFAACATLDASRVAGQLHLSGRAGRPPGRHGLGLRRLRGQVVRVAASRPWVRRGYDGFPVRARPSAAVGADAGASGCHGPAASARPPRGACVHLGSDLVFDSGRSGRSGRSGDDRRVRAASSPPRPVHGERGAHARDAVRRGSAPGAERPSGVCAVDAPRRGAQWRSGAADRSSGRACSGDGDGRRPAAAAGRPGAGVPVAGVPAAAAAAARRRSAGHGPLVRRGTTGGASDRRAPGVAATAAAARPAGDPRRPSAGGAAARRRARAAAGTVPRPPCRVDRRSLRDARRGREHRSSAGGTRVPRVRRRAATGSPRPGGTRAASASRWRASSARRSARRTPLRASHCPRAPRPGRASARHGSSGRSPFCRRRPAPRPRAPTC